MIDQETAIVVVTYQRNGLLQVLFDSFLQTALKPGLVIVVDNGNDPEVNKLCQQLEADLALNLQADIAAGAQPCKVIYAAQETNSGGAGGFSAGTKIAYQAGAQWIWLMDDDVKILPDALEKLRPWMDSAIEQDHRVIQCSRLNVDGQPFFWQYNFMARLAIHNPLTPAGFNPGETHRPMNNACFEGGLFHRSIVSQIGLPDYRFFIYWDDAVYGYLSSKVTKPILLKEALMQRTREIDHMNIGRSKKLNATSDMSRYYIMRNRGYIAKYVALQGEYNPFLFWLGTIFSSFKEFIRLFITKDFKSGFKALREGRRDARAIIKDDTWQPMPKLEDDQLCN